MKTVSAAFAFAVLAGLATVSVEPQSAHAAVTCAATKITASKMGTSLKAAKVSAITDWRNKVKAAHGPAWTYWKKAADKKMGCKKTCPKATCAVGPFNCQASAKPCK